ncbi:MAG TPA: CvpA family protein [Acetobacteraceae bacterium]|jgi:membrane protein required for colicin V production
MTWVDLVVLAVLAISGLLAFMRGLVREVLGIAAWAGAIAAAIWGLPLLRPQLQQWMRGSPWIDPVGFVAIFIVSLIVLMIVARIIGRAVRNSPLGGLDRTLGLVFGLARGAALVIVAYIVAGMVVPVDQWPPPVLQARLLTPAFIGARWTVHQLPTDYRPRLYAPPPGRETTAQALLQSTPQGSAIGPVAAHPPARD